MKNFSKTLLLTLMLPLAGLLVRVPWARLPEILGTPVVAQALRLSFATSTLSTLIALVLGLPLATAWPLRADQRGSE